MGRQRIVFALGALWLAGGILAAGSAAAQERAGTITGTVMDAGRYALSGARIELDPRGQAVVSDQQGRFTMPNVPAADYTITISYVGLLPFTEKLSVIPDQVTQVEAVLLAAVRLERGRHDQAVRLYETSMRERYPRTTRPVAVVHDGLLSRN